MRTYLTLLPLVLLTLFACAGDVDPSLDPESPPEDDLPAEWDDVVLTPEGPPDEEGPGEPTVDPAEETLVYAGAPQVVYVNFDGVTVSDCDNYCSDAPTNRSFAIGAHFGVSSKAFAPYGGGATARGEIMKKLRSMYSRYNVTFTATRPSGGDYTMVIISPSTGPGHGVAPLNCGNTNRRDIAFVFKIGSSSTSTIARYAAHELGHTFGLAHVVSSADVMQWASSGSSFTTSAYDSGHPSGTCFSGSTQYADKLLTDALGLKQVSAWVPVAGGATDVGVGANGSVWIIGSSPEAGGYGIYQRSGSGWTKRAGGAVRIAVDQAGYPWIVNSAGWIYRWTGSGWGRKPGLATDIGAGADGSIWILGRSADGNGNYQAYRWNSASGGWDNHGTAGVRIAVDPAGRPWVTTAGKGIRRWDGSSFQVINGNATDIGVGADGTVWITGASPVSGGYRIFRRTSSGSWTQFSGGAVALSVGPAGKPWIANSASKIYYLP